MLYVFHVDTGRMITFDMNVALENVQYLKEMIEQHYHIPAASQVLLVSGGEMLHPQNRICSYVGGTDSNPIFMFSTNIIESKNPPQPWPSIEPDTDLKDQVERCLSLPANYSTVVKRAQLAQHIYELGREEFRTSEKLVHEQHLQQLGWAAVVANMEDLTEEFKKRCDDFQNVFNEVLDKRSDYLDCLSHFNEDLDKLSSIPILPALLQNAEKPFHAFDDVYDNDSFQKEKEKSEACTKSREVTPEASGQEGNSSNSSNSVEKKEVVSSEREDESAMTLLQWISAQENQISLRKMAAECIKSLEQFDEKEMTNLKTEVKNAIEAAQKEDMKLIKGLEDRLSGLDKLMFDVKNIVKEQNELSQAFQQNQTRANNLGDTSILPDLCVSHKNQLMVMTKNHKQLRDIRSRISRAKLELGHNLLQRLKFIIYIENRMYEIDSKLLFIHRNCRRLQKHMGIIEQIHQAPSVYVTAVTEVVRRRNFSSAFLTWASDLAGHLMQIYSDEVMRRQEFWAMFEGHFLCTLFPGMDDMPPAYATEAPSMFDSSLPNLTKSDINELSVRLPDIGSKIELPDLTAVIEFFSSRSGSKNREKSVTSDGDSAKIPLSRSMAVGTSDLPKILDIHSHLKDYERGFESETDTEEFEKVGQSPIDRRRISTTGSLQTYATLACSTQTSQAPCVLAKPEMCTISTSTEAIATQNIETLTESSLSIPSKKTPRCFNKLTTMKSVDSNNSLTFSTGSTLPSIPEITSPISHVDVNNSSTSSSVTTSIQSPEEEADCGSGEKILGHPASTQQNFPSTFDSEFINSEFYIDESLPSSLSSDRVDGLGRNVMITPDEDKGKILLDCMEQQLNCDTVIKLLQENLGTTRCEVEHLKNILRELHSQSRSSIDALKDQVKIIRNDSESGRTDINCQLKSLTSAWQVVKQEIGTHQQELIKRTVDHEFELNDLRKNLDSSNETIQSLQNEKKTLEEEHMLAIKKYESIFNELNATVRSLKEATTDFQAREARAQEEKEKLVKEITEKLTRDHKSELESLRSRYRLMTSIERSPSDTSLEKIERPDLLEMSGHEAVFHTREDIERGGVPIISGRSRWESRSGMGALFLAGSPKSPSKTQDLYKRILEDKDNQLELMRQREDQLLKDITRLQDTIQNLTEPDLSDMNSVSVLKEKMDFLQKDKSRLEQELETEKFKRQEMESSFAALKVVTPDSTAVSPDQMTRSGARSKMSASMLNRGLISVSTCSKGDLVLIVWNGSHEQYIIVQEASILYFLHGESYNTLKLPRIAASETPSVTHVIAKVVEKEFCVARKDENRYKVSKGTKFYRVKVEPRSSSPLPATVARKLEMGQSSGSVSRSTSTELPVSSSNPQQTSSVHLMSSFAQTDCLDTLIEDVATSKDMVDSGVDAQQKSVYKERNVSVTEEDEPTSLTEQRCRYISVSEEDEATVENASEVPNQFLVDLMSDPEDSDEYRSLESKDGSD